MMQPLIEILGSYQSVWSVIISLVLFILFSALACKVCGKNFIMGLIDKSGATVVELKFGRSISGWPLFGSFTLAALVISPLRLSLIALFPHQAMAVAITSFICLLLSFLIILAIVAMMAVSIIVASYWNYLR